MGWIPGWRALGVFWGVVLAVLGLGAGVLALLGPPAPPPTAAGVPPRYHGNNTAWPGPPPRRTGAPIRGPDAALLEAAPDFPNARLPRIGPDRRRPAETYAAFADAAQPGIKLALVVAGIGLDQADSLAAIHALPAAIDLAVSAYAADPAPLLNAARATGHEFLVSLPMEPSGYPENDEGTRQLLTTATPGENAQNLQWALSRIEGYAGVTGASDGQRGERFAASPAAMATVGAELARRGLFYLDPRPDGEPPAGVEARPVDQVIDSGDAMAASLARLEQRARDHGSSIGLVGRPSPTAVAALEIWAGGLASRGIELVPASALILRHEAR